MPGLRRARQSYLSIALANVYPTRCDSTTPLHRRRMPSYSTNLRSLRVSKGRFLASDTNKQERAILREKAPPPDALSRRRRLDRQRRDPHVLPRLSRHPKTLWTSWLLHIHTPRPRMNIGKACIRCHRLLWACFIGPRVGSWRLWRFSGRTRRGNGVVVVCCMDLTFIP